MQFRVIYTDKSGSFATGLTRQAAIAITSAARRNQRTCYIAPERVRLSDLRALRYTLATNRYKALTRGTL